MEVTITTQKAGKADALNKYEVMVKGRDKTFVKLTYPPRDIGRFLLMLARDLWIYLPDVGKPVRIPLQQRLVGQVANGDIARTNYSDDYTAEVLAEETHNGKTYDVLDLTAKSKEVTYSRIRYWVETETFHPSKAEFYTASGRLLKTGFFEEYQMAEGALRPMRLRLVDGLNPQEVSIMDYSHLRRAEIPGKIFNKNCMSRME